MKAERIKGMPFRWRFNLIIAVLTLFSIGQFGSMYPTFHADNGTLGSILVSVFLFVFNWIQIAVPVYIWYLIKKRSEKRSVNGVTE